LFYRQRLKSPLQVAFVATSTDIDSWARVPTKKTGNIRNFQRAEIPVHIDEVKSFFKNEVNASPTAVVVGFDTIRSPGRVRALIDHGRELDESTIGPDKPVLGHLEITWTEDTDPRSQEDLVRAILDRYGLLKSFVFQELQALADLNATHADAILNSIRERALRGDLALATLIDELSDTTEESEAPEAGQNELDESVIPEDLREALAGLSPSDLQVVLGRLHMLSQLQEPLLRKQSVETLQDFYREVTNEIKPGLLIDGQHRILGTKKLGDIPFLVTALPTASWPELAFQFIVTNRTARKVPESLLISIVGNSLSKQQRSEIEERLRLANIRVGLIEAVMRVQEDESSPFSGLIAFGVRGEPGFIDAAAMRGKVIKLWYDRRQPVRTLFDHFCQGRRVDEKTEYWRDEELWFDSFNRFWSTVRDRYAGTAVFSSEVTQTEPKKVAASKLMTATVLMIFQDTVLRTIEDLVNKKNTVERIPVSASIPDFDHFGTMVKNMLERLTPDFFEGWQLSGFDGSRGAREDLADAIRKVIEGDRTVAELKAGRNIHRLFRPATE